jgi:hypothetical protein
LSNESTEGVAGKRLYSPAAVATFSVIGGLALGCLLYGLNSRRRGGKGLATVLLVVAAASFLFMAVGAGLRAHISLYGALGLFGAIGFYNLESGPFERAVAKGAVRAKWWPAALIALVSYLVIGVAVLLVRGGAEGR